MANEPAISDLELEAQWCDEIGNLFEVAASRYRRFAALLRLTRGALPANDVEGERLELRRINYRLAAILRAEDDRQKGGVAE